jgi:hypothetical protein
VPAPENVSKSNGVSLPVRYAVWVCAGRIHTSWWQRSTSLLRRANALLAAMLERIEGNSVRTIILKTASRFARDLMVHTWRTSLAVGVSSMKDRSPGTCAPRSFATVRADRRRRRLLGRAGDLSRGKIWRSPHRMIKILAARQAAVFVPAVASCIEGQPRAPAPAILTSWPARTLRQEAVVHKSWEG